MRHIYLFIIFISSVSYAQVNDNLAQNTADRLLADDNRLSIGGYGQIDYNQQLGSDTHYNGKLDVHRLVMMFGYKFSDNTKFITEVEYEHVKEVYIEQAFLDHRINNFINFRAGLLLIPMGIINEYHEPTTFNGVERPNVDKYITPTTWREIGVGFTGRVQAASLKYQLYVVNGFNGYEDGIAKFTGKKGLRSGRQKGAESFMTSPALSSKIDFYGIQRLKIGASAYVGKSSSTAYDGLDMTDVAAVASADSTVVNLKIFGLDARYNYKGFALRGQIISTNVGNTEAYNNKTNSDMGSNLMGYYAEVGYDLFSTSTNIKSELIPFIRYESYDTQNQMEREINKNDAYHRTEITMGLGWRITPGSILKVDYQILKTAATGSVDKNMLNMGVGVWF